MAPAEGCSSLLQPHCHWSGQRGVVTHGASLVVSCSLCSQKITNSCSREWRISYSWKSVVLREYNTSFGFSRVTLNIMDYFPVLPEFLHKGNNLDSLDTIALCVYLTRLIGWWGLICKIVWFNDKLFHYITVASCARIGVWNAHNRARCIVIQLFKLFLYKKILPSFLIAY